MSVGTLAATLDPNAPRPYKQGREFVQRVAIAITGNYATGGVVVDLSGLGCPGSSPPFAWDIKSNANSGQSYDYDPGTTRALGKVLSFAGASQDGDDGSWPDTGLLAEFRYR
jgi:hypothetical protein